MAGGLLREVWPEFAKLCRVEFGVVLLIILVVLLIILVVLVLLSLRWVRRYYRQNLISMRDVAVQMIQNRPPTDDATRLQHNVNWWETEVLKILPRAGAKSDEIAWFTRCGAAGNVYHRGMIAEKIARLDAIIDRLEGEI